MEVRLLSRALRLLTKESFYVIIYGFITQLIIALRLTSFAQSKPSYTHKRLGACPERGEAESRGGKSELPQMQIRVMAVGNAHHSCRKARSGKAPT